MQKSLPKSLIIKDFKALSKWYEKYEPDVILCSERQLEQYKALFTKPKHRVSHRPMNMAGMRRIWTFRGSLLKVNV